MKTDYSYLLEEYPETISKDQLYKICHISKRKASWYLENGIIPCEDNGKQTRRYTIRIKDVIKFLEKQEAGKLKKLPPPGSFTSKSPSRKINYVRVAPSAFAALLKEQWKQQPDALSTEQAAQLLGYTTATIAKWIRSDKFKVVPYQRGYMIPKDWLIQYLVDTVNQSRTSKSAKHMQLIQKCQKK